MINKISIDVNMKRIRHYGVFSSKWDTFIISLVRKSQESWWKSGTESLTEPEAVYVFNKTVFAGHDRDIANMNVKQL